jgi:hypothetical protein
MSTASLQRKISKILLKNLVFKFFLYAKKNFCPPPNVLARASSYEKHQDLAIKPILPGRSYNNNNQCSSLLVLIKNTKQTTFALADTGSHNTTQQLPNVLFIIQPFYAISLSSILVLA